MAAQAHTAPAVPEGLARAHAVDDAPTTRDDDDDDDELDADGAVWETASLFEDILDDVAALDYSTNSTCIPTPPPTTTTTTAAANPP